MRKKLKPRLPIEAVQKLKSHPVSTKKGEKGYDRKRIKRQNRKNMKAEIISPEDNVEENN